MRGFNSNGQLGNNSTINTTHLSWALFHKRRRDGHGHGDGNGDGLNDG
jgi:hypothetical protein